MRKDSPFLNVREKINQILDNEPGLPDYSVITRIEVVCLDVKRQIEAGKTIERRGLTGGRGKDKN